MRRVLFNLVLLTVAVGTAATWAWAGDSRHDSPPAAPMASMPGMSAAAAAPSTNPVLVDALARARLATAKYVTNLEAAKADGYQIITKMIPDMGWHFLNMKVTGFDVTKPPILVYEKHETKWQLAALEWVFPETPATPPLPDATYGSFPAACHYADGTFIPAAAQSACAPTSPDGAAFTFWHPNLVTLHVWLWYPNPSGLYASMNPYVHPFNVG
jgi:hypothetical protein